MTWPPVLPPTRTLVIAGLVVLGVALAVLGGWVWWDAHQRRVLEAHAAVMARIQPGLVPDASADARTAAAKELEQLLERYPSARTVPEAAYELGNVRFASGQYVPARAGRCSEAPAASCAHWSGPRWLARGRPSATSAARPRRTEPW
jgi:hypothetical protein